MLGTVAVVGLAAGGMAARVVLSAPLAAALKGD